MRNCQMLDKDRHRGARATGDLEDPVRGSAIDRGRCLTGSDDVQCFRAYAGIEILQQKLAGGRGHGVSARGEIDRVRGVGIGIRGTEGVDEAPSHY